MGREGESEITFADGRICSGSSPCPCSFSRRCRDSRLLNRSPPACVRATSLLFRINLGIYTDLVLGTRRGSGSAAWPTPPPNAGLLPGMPSAGNAAPSRALPWHRECCSQSPSPPHPVPPGAMGFSRDAAQGTFPHLPAAQGHLRGVKSAQASSWRLQEGVLRAGKR